MSAGARRVPPRAREHGSARGRRAGGGASGRASGRACARGVHLTELHEEKKTMTFFLRFFLRKVKSSMKRWLAAAKRDFLIGGAR